MDPRANISCHRPAVVARQPGRHVVSSGAWVTPAARFYKEGAPPELARGLDGVPGVGGGNEQWVGLSHFRLYAFVGKALCAWWAVYWSGVRQMQKSATDPFLEIVRKLEGF